MRASEIIREEWGDLGPQVWAPGRDGKPPPTPPRVTRLRASPAQKRRRPVGALAVQFYSVTDRPRVGSSVRCEFWLLRGRTEPEILYFSGRTTLEADRSVSRQGSL